MSRSPDPTGVKVPDSEIVTNPDALRQDKRIYRAGRNGLTIGLMIGAVLGVISPIAWGLYGLPLILPWGAWSGWNALRPANSLSFALIGALEWSLVGFVIGRFVGAVNRVKPNSQ